MPWTAYARCLGLEETLAIRDHPAKPVGRRRVRRRGPRDADDPQDGGGGLPTVHGPVARDPQRVPHDPEEVGRVGAGPPREQLSRRAYPPSSSTGSTSRGSLIKRGHEPRPHRQQGPRASPRHPIVGLGAGADRGTAAVPRARTARRCRPALSYPTKINALYFATFKMGPPRGWDRPFPVGRYWPVPWSSSSTMASTPGPSGSPRPPTSRSSGDTSFGIGSRRTARPRSSHLGGGCYHRRVKTGKAFSGR